MFAPVTFSPSATVAGMADELGASLDALKDAFADGAGALGGLGLPGSAPGTGQEEMQALRDQATGTVATPVNFLAITPYMAGVGVRRGENAFLTAEQALATLTGLFSAPQGLDDLLQEKGLVVLCAAARTQGELAAALDSFNRVYPLAQLEQACRRAKALARLETEKFVVPAAPSYPAWGAIAPQKNSKGQAVARALGGMLAAGEGAARAATAPGDMLAAFAQKQAQKLAQKAADLAHLADSMAGSLDAWRGFAVQAPGPALFRALSKLPLPFDAAFKCVALLCWYGAPEAVAYYRESFGLCRRTLTNPACLLCAGDASQCPI